MQCYVNIKEVFVVPGEYVFVTVTLTLLRCYSVTLLRYCIVALLQISRMVLWSWA